MSLSTLPKYKKKKGSKHSPKGDYIVFERYKEIVAAEQIEDYKILWYMLWWGLMRIQEGLSRTPKDLIMQEKGPIMAVYRKKTKGFSAIPIPRKVYDEMLAYITKNDIKPNQHIVQRERSTVNRYLKKYGKVVSNQKFIHPHAFRRGSGIWMLQNGKTVAEMQLLFGHTNFQTTLRYLELGDEALVMNRHRDFIDGMGS